jgi:hypothetical protein
MPINLRFTYDDKESNVEIKLTKIFNLKIDIDEFFKLILTTKKNRDKVTLDSLLFNAGLFIRSRKILRWVCKQSDVRKVTLILYQNYEWPSLIVSSWTILSGIKSLIHNLFYQVEDEHYMINDDEKLQFQFDIVMQTRIFFAILAILFNIKDLFKILKYMKVYYGKSNI